MLFFTNLKQKPNLFKETKNNILVQLAIEKVSILKYIYKNTIKI